MKQLKKLCKNQKRLLSKCGLNPADWMCRFEDDNYLHIVNKESRKVKIIDKDTMEVLDTGWTLQI